MGLCGSKLSAEEKMSRELDKKNKEDFDREASKIKLLLLGAGESGKSTIFKQMKILYGAGYSREDQEAFVPIVYQNVISSMKVLVLNAKALGEEVKVPESADAIEAADEDAVVDAELGGHVQALWADPGIQATYEQRAKFQLFDSADFYFKAIDRVMADDYLCTDEDILKSRVRTSGIVEEKYNIDGVDFVMFDVGGQRNERKKWIHCFDDVTAVIFVAAISEYDQVCYEDSKQNRIDEATELFDDIVGNRWFQETDMILFLNKKDLFEKKIRKVEMRDEESGRFLDYEGGMCSCGKGECYCGAEDAGKKYLLEKFLEKNANPDKEIYYHITCATDTSNVATVFNACTDIILKKNLQGSGFME